jgi:hypothetical protein
MIFFHLLFAHLLADYVLQTDWLAARKSQATDGLLIHGLMVYAMSLLVLAPYWNMVFWWVTLLFVIHTTQDWMKVRIGRRLPLPLAYFLDQALHLALIVLIAVQVDVNPSDWEVLAMALGACLILVTRFYEVSWWANWFEMIPYMQRWQIWSDVERVVMLLLSAVGLVVLAPVAALPRLVYAWRYEEPLWRTRYGVLEWGIGIVFCVILGYFGIFQL